MKIPIPNTMSINRKLAKTYSGIFGHQVVLKNRGGKIVMTIVPVRPKLEPTEKQVAIRERLKLAALYGSKVINDPVLSAEYSAKQRKGMTIYRQAMNNFLRMPFISRIDTSDYHGNPGDKIKVTAGDDFKLTSVTVKISGSDGNMIEEGDCALNPPAGAYEYTSTMKHTTLAGTVIRAQAKDLPGNVKELSVTL